MKRVLVTGGNGFLGSNVVNEIKTQLGVVSKNTNQLELNLPNVTTTLDYHEEEQ